MTDPNNATPDVRGEPFLELMFESGRMSGHKFPLALAAELANLQKLFEIVARAQVQEETKADRVPYGLIPALQLSIADTRHNCFTLQIEPLQDRVPEAFLKPMQAAREKVLDGLEAIRDKGALPASFSVPIRSRFLQLGRKLASDERLTIRRKSPAGTREVRIDYATLAKLDAAQTENGSSEQVLEGEAHSVAAGKLTIRQAGKKFECLLRDEDFRLATDALHQNPALLLRIEGKVIESASGGRIDYTDIAAVEHKRFADIKAVEDRIRSLRQVKPGWHDGVGEAPREAALAKCERVIARIIADDDAIPAPRLMCDDFGAVIAEWISDNAYLEVRFDAREQMIFAESSRPGKALAETFFDWSNIDGSNADLLATWIRGCMQ
jgi:hypothetical protein